MSPNKLVLPSSVQTRSDVARLVKEIVEYEELARQAGLRGVRVPGPNHLSVPLRATAEVFRVALDDPMARRKFSDRLKYLHKAAPVVQISFAVQPPMHVVDSVLSWFRTNGHPATLVRVSVDPSVVVGCRIRTTNKSFDFSFARLLDEAQKTLAQEVSAL
ncbi:hypothetical protein BGO17_03315 [Candidatus Saccharibacteria bacterium 49-20]|nr:MAG: hypothetical protein BGO17_03315 [Candidatus Saccharibacteria bacterium 49-20]